MLGIAAVGGPGGRWLIGRLSAPWPAVVEIVAGVLLMLAGLVVANQARADLGDSLRIAPTPLEDAEFVDRGWYGRVRHPLYLAVFLGVVGWAAVWMNLFVLAVTAIIIAFFGMKTRYEERVLRETYPDYANYMMRVKARFVPRVW